VVERVEMERKKVRETDTEEHCFARASKRFEKFCHNSLSSEGEILQKLKKRT